MTDKIKLDYGLAEEMIRTFENGVEQLQDTMQEMQNIATMIEGGALLGQGGDAFKDAIRSKLAPAIGRLTDKFEELSRDVGEAVKLMREADNQSRGAFRG
ncbi:MAG: WXG100 family type VII secretion target [Caldilineaceae bacterium]|nr:WXG100 family type VII secretion target [Caldilineaceae bacterium]